MTLVVFILEDALSVWTNLGKHLSFVGLCVSSIKTGTRRIIRLDELSFVIRLERRTTEDSSSRRIIRLVPVFILETHNPIVWKDSRLLPPYSQGPLWVRGTRRLTFQTNNPTNNKCLPKFVQTNNASSSIKTTIVTHSHFLVFYTKIDSIFNKEQFSQFDFFFL